jgi:hypothetical protein
MENVLIQPPSIMASKVPRITLQVSQEIYAFMAAECKAQGRTLSNLASFWIQQRVVQFTTALTKDKPSF